MNIKRERFHHLKLPFFFLLVLFNACQENFPLGEKFIVSQTEINLIDTLSVKLSTVILDTLNSCGTGAMLVGSYEDETFGKFSSTSYFQLGVPSENDIQTDDVFDSLRLVLKYNKYSFGDTTLSFNLSVHRLLERIEFDYDNVIKSATTFAYDPEPIGSVTFTPRPNSPDDSISIRISNELGSEFFNKMMQANEIFDSAEKFCDYFSGIVLVSSEPSKGLILGFSVEAGKVKFVLHTSRKKDLAEEEIIYNFGLYDSEKQFNNLTRDFSATPLSALTQQRYDLPSTETDELTYIQGGTGLAIKVIFPSLPEILLRDRGKIVEAKLSITPLKNSYKEFELPSQLLIYEMDKLNRIFDSQSSLASSKLLVDDLYNEETTYSFDITSYLDYELSDSYVNPERGLLISLPSYSLQNSFDRLIIDADNKNTMLEIYYLSY